MVQTLDENEDNRSHQWDEVERQVHEVTNDGLRPESLERVLQDLSKPRNRGVSWLNLTTFFDNLSRVSGDEGAIKSIEEGIFEEPVA